MVLLGILGTILKIIGIVLLIILLFLLVILLVPLRYRIQLSKEGEKLEATAEASYFLKCVRFIVTFREKKLAYKAKVLCFTCLSSEVKKNPSKKKIKKKKSKKRGTDEKAKTEENPEAEENPEIEEKTETGGLLDGTEAKDEGKEEATGKEETQKEGSIGEKSAEGNRIAEENSTADGSSIAEGNNTADGSSIAERNSTAQGNSTADESSTEEGNIKNEIEETENPEKGNQEEPESGGIFQRLFKKLWQLCSLPGQIVKKIKGKIQALVEKIRAIWDNIRGILQKILSIIRQGGEKYGYLKEFFQDEVNKNGIKYTGKTIFKLLKHVIPYKMKGEIILGTGDAYSMGQILSALGMFYPLYAKNLNIQADFEAEGFLLESKLLLKGRIRLGTILVLLIRLWFKGKLKKCLSNAMALKDRLLEPVSMK